MGHVYSPEVMFASQCEALESALWTAVHALQERAAMSRRLAATMKAQDSARIAEKLESEARDAEQHAGVVRGIIESVVTAGNRQDCSERA